MFPYSAASRTVICFVSIGDKFGICPVVGLNVRLVELKYPHSSVPSTYFSCTGTRLAYREGAPWYELGTDFMFEPTTSKQMPPFLSLNAEAGFFTN